MTILKIKLPTYHATKVYNKQRSKAPGILNISTLWRAVISFSLWLLYPTESALGTHKLFLVW